MANYFQDPAQQFVPTPVYVPPFEALQNTLQTRQGKYDEGLNRIRSARNSVFNAPLTKNENLMVRSQYLDEADKKLKDLSQVNLSQEANVMEGSKVYGNFFKDNDVLTDMVYTRSQTNELDKFNSFKPEKDSFEYADPRSLQDMQNGVERVRNSKRGDMSQYQVREFTPFTDVQKYVSKMVTDNKIAIENVTSNGQVVYKKTNGPESLGNWMTIASSLTQDRFMKQFQVEARVAKEEGIKAAKSYVKNSTGVDINDEQALSTYIKNVYENNFKSFTKLTKSYDDKLTRLKTARDKYVTENPDGSSQELDAYNNEIRITQAALKSAADSKNLYDPSTTEYNSAIQKFTDSPDAAMYDQIRNTTINNLATFFAANESKTIPVEDAGYKIAAAAQQQAFANTLANQKAIDEHGKAVDDHLESQAKLNGTWKGDGSGKGTPGEPGSSSKKSEEDDAGKLHYVGPVGNDYQAIDPVKRFEQEQQQRYDAALSTFLDPDSTAGILEKASGGTISYEDVVAYTTAVKSARGYSEFTDNEKAASNKIVAFLKDKGVNFSSGGKYGTAAALHTFAGNYFNEVKGTDKWNDQVMKIWNDDTAAGSLIEEYNNLNKVKSDGIKSALSDPKYKNLIVDRGNGMSDIVTADDLLKDVGGMHETSYLSDFMKDYLNGKIATHLHMGENGPEIEIYKDGKFTKKIKDVNDVYILDKFQSKWGTSESIGDNFKKANDIAVNNIPGYTKKDGVMGQEFTYHFSPTPKDTDLGVKVIKEVTLPGNMEANKVIDQEGKPVDPDNYTDKGYNLLMSKIHTWGAKEIAEYMNPPIYHTMNSNGTPTVLLSFKSLSDEKVKELGISGMDELKELPASIEIPLQENKSPDLQNLLHPDAGMYTYGKLLRGESVKAGSLEKGLNFDYEMIPNSTTNPTQVRVSIRTKQLNDKGELIDMNPDPFVLKFSDYTPDEMKAEVNSFIMQHIQRNVAAQKQITDASKIKTKEEQDRIAAFKKYAEQTDPLKN